MGDYGSNALVIDFKAPLHPCFGYKIAGRSNPSGRFTRQVPQSSESGVNQQAKPHISVVLKLFRPLKENCPKGKPRLISGVESLDLAQVEANLGLIPWASGTGRVSRSMPVRAACLSLS